MKNRVTRCGIVAMAIVTCVATRAHAQIRASENAVVSQTVDGTVFTIAYSRPQARGRTELFGKTIKMGEIWTPGANWATTLEVSRDIVLDGHAVPKGKYSVWFVVRATEWTLILDPRFLRFHEDRPDSIARQIRFATRPAVARPVEILSWSFPEVRADGVLIRFEWGSKRVELNATVQASHPIPIARAEALPFLGLYEWKWADDVGEDTLVHRVEFTHDGTVMRQTHTPFPDWYRLVQGQPMVRINDEWFITAIFVRGKIYEMDSDMVWEFTMKDGIAVSFELRDSKDFLLANGRRVQR